MCIKFSLKKMNTLTQDNQWSPNIRRFHKEQM